MPVRRKLTITALARRLGLSKSTVSKALSPHPDRGDVGAATRERVRAAAARLGWTTDEQRSARARRRVGNIGLVFQRTAPLSDSMYGNLLDGLGQAMAVRQRRLLFVPALHDSDWPRLLCDQRIDGALLMEPIGTGLVRTVSQERFPAVLINQESGGPIPQVLCDDARSIGLAVDRLVLAGHRRLALLRSPNRRGHYSVRERRAGFLAACQRHGVHGEDLAHEAAPFAAAWRQRQVGTRATAVVCYNHQDALELLSAAASLRIAVPQDLSLISADDLGILTLMPTPVTALAVDVATLAETAVSLLCELIAGRRVMANTVVRIPATLIERATVASPGRRRR